MNKINDTLLKLLSVSLGCGPSVQIDLNQDEWKQLYHEAFAHQIQLIIFQESNKYGYKVDPSLFEEWKKYLFLSIFTYERRSSIASNILNAFQNLTIPVMVLKGLYFRHLYQYPSIRTMGDIDLFTTKEYLNDAIKVIESFGYKQRIEKKDLKHTSFYHENYIEIELHYSLVTENRRMAAANFNNEIWNSTNIYKSDEITFLVPSDLNHLIYCCIHMTNHLGDGGFGLRQLSDFILLTKKTINTTDFTKITDQAYEYGVGKFFEALLCISYKFFNVEIPDAVMRILDQNEVYISNLLNLIFDSGVFGGKNLSSASNRSLASYLSQYEKSAKRFNLRYIFPPRQDLSSAYSYAQKNAILLPIAWIHRLFNNIIRTDLNMLEKIPNSKEINEYIKLFRWLDIK